MCTGPALEDDGGSSSPAFHVLLLTLFLIICSQGLTSFSLQDKGTFLLVLDGKTFEELGRANVPVNMAYGFHGTYNAAA